MKKADKHAYHQKSIAELEKELFSIQKQLVETRIKHGAGQLKDSSLLKKSKYLTTLILTLITQKKNEPKKQK